LNPILLLSFVVSEMSQTVETSLSLLKESEQTLFERYLMIVNRKVLEYFKFFEEHLKNVNCNPYRCSSIRIVTFPTLGTVYMFIELLRFKVMFDLKCLIEIESERLDNDKDDNVVYKFKIIVTQFKD